MRADVNGDGVVNGLDLSIMTKQYLQTFPHNYYPPNGVDTGLQRLDQNGDNVINGLDFRFADKVYLQHVSNCP